MKFYYISLVIISAFTFHGHLSAERVALEDGLAVLHIDSSEPLTFSYENREGNIKIQGIPEQEIRIKLDHDNDEELPSFLEWDDNARTVALKLLGDAAEQDMKVFLPVNSRIKLKSVEDSIYVSGIRGTIEISSVDGNVVITDSSGSVLVENVNGNIDLVAAASEAEDPISLTTVDGNITMQIPEDFDGDFELVTLDGDINFDIPGSITLNKGSGPDPGWGFHHMKKQAITVNKGGRRILLSTVDGNLNILSR